MELGENHLKVRKASIGITQVAGVEMGVNAMSMLAGTTSTDSEVTRILQLLNMVTPEELMDNDDYEGTSNVFERKKPIRMADLLTTLQRFVTTFARSAPSTARLSKSRFLDQLAAVDSLPAWARFMSSMTPLNRLLRLSRPWLAGSSPTGPWSQRTSRRRTLRWALGKRATRGHVIAAWERVRRVSRDQSMRGEARSST